MGLWGDGPFCPEEAISWTGECIYDTHDRQVSMSYFYCASSSSEDLLSGLCLQVLFLSEDSVSLGDIPVLVPSSRILFLTNTSHTDSAVYTWLFPQQSLQVGHVRCFGSDLELRMVVKPCRPALPALTDQSRKGPGSSRRMWPVRPHLHSLRLPHRLSAGPRLSGTGILSCVSAVQQPVC